MIKPAKEDYEILRMYKLYDNSQYEIVILMDSGKVYIATIKTLKDRPKWNLAKKWRRNKNQSVQCWKQCRFMEGYHLI